MYLEMPETLAKRIRHFSYLYYNEISGISDEEFDLMVEQLKSVDPDNPVLFEVGSMPKRGELKKHYNKMYSLDKAKEFDEFKNGFFQKFISKQMVMSYKEDGCAGEIYYDEGKLVLAITRGNGEYGQDITQQARAVENLPNNIDFKDQLFVYGEFTMKTDKFNELSGEYTNPRNLVNGTMRPDGDSDLVKYRGIEFRAYNCEGFVASGYSGRLSRLREFKISTVNYRCTNELGEMEKWYNKTLERRENLTTQIDGFCVFLDNLNDWEELGHTSHHPRFAVAIKFPSAGAIVEITNIRWDISRNGTLTPVAQFEPTLLSGAMVSNCTLHNWKTLNDNRLQLGVEIEVKRSGDVIPYFIGRVEELGEVPLPAKYPYRCPYCDSETSIDNNCVRLKCLNEECKEQLVMFIEDMLDRLDHKGLAAQQIRILVDTYSMKSIWDLWVLYESNFEILGHNQGPKVYHSLIEIKKDVPLWRFIWFLGIPMVGKTVSKKLASAYKSFDGIRNYPQGPHIFDVIGDGVLYNNFIGWYSYDSEDVEHQIKKHNFEIQSMEVNEMKDSKTFCITGTLSVGRKEMEKKIEEAGHIFKNSMTKEVDYLVCGDNIGQNKIEKADKYGIKRICEGEFLSLIGS